MENLIVICPWCGGDHWVDVFAGDVEFFTHCTNCGKGFLVRAERRTTVLGLPIAPPEETSEEAGDTEY